MGQMGQMDFSIPPHPGPVFPGGGQMSQMGGQGGGGQGQGPTTGGAACYCVPDSNTPTITFTDSPLSGGGPCYKIRRYVATWTYTCKLRTQRPPRPEDTYQPPAAPDGATDQFGNPSQPTNQKTVLSGNHTCGGSGGCGNKTCKTAKVMWSITYCHVTEPGGGISAGDVQEVDGGENGGTPVSPGNVAIGSNTPAFGNTTTSQDPIVGQVINSGNTNANLPPQATATGDNVSNFPLYPTEDEVFDPEHNLLISTNQTLLSYARNEAGNPVFSNEGVLRDKINVAVGDVLRGNTPFSGIGISTVLYNQQAIPESLKDSARERLEEASKFNVSSKDGKGLLTAAIRRATILGTVSGYNQEVLDEIIKAGKTFFPYGVPEMPKGFTDTGSRLKYSIVRNSQPASIFTGQYSNGDRKREIQRWRAMPTDIDLTVSVKTKSGKLTGVRVRDDDGITVRGITDAGTNTSSVYQLNEFVKVRKADSTIETVSLVSNRDKAFVIPPQQETMIRTYEPELVVSSLTYGGSGSVEVSGEGSAIPSVMLFSSTRETIRTEAAGDIDFTNTTVDYELAWDSITNGNNYENFNATVSSWSGPRMSIYIDYRDPIWNYLLEKNTVQLKMTDFTRALDGKVFARKIYTDFAIYPTNLIKYSPYQGRSNLETFVEGQHSVRTMRIVNNPLQSVAQENYVQSAKTANGKAPSLKEDNYAFEYAARESVVGEASTLHGTETSFTTIKSPLAEVFSRVKAIDDNYNIEDGARGKRILQPDVFFNMTAAEVAEFFEFVPGTIISNLFAGSYNNIKVEPVELQDLEKTFLTADRLTGTPLTNKVQSTALNNARYFPTEFLGRLYK